MLVYVQVLYFVSRVFVVYFGIYFNMWEVNFDVFEFCIVVVVMSGFFEYIF